MRHVFVVVFWLASVTRSFAQPAPVVDPVAEAPIRLGAIGLAPRIGLTNVGVDTNVFNEVEDPKQDFTLTASPGMQLWLRLQRGLLSVDGQGDYVYFNKHADQRS